MKIMSKCNVFVISLFTLGLLGCASTKDNMVAKGFPVQYAEGFDDGCHSGYKAAGSLFDEFKKDISRFNSDKKYAQGWSDGFRQCESEQEAIERQTRITIEQQKLIEQRKANERSETYFLEKHALEGVDTSGLESLTPK
ncbi:hypothetical protein HJ092_14540 [Vibrio parahaemolyticus]|nr:hypothetical protein [Vibrio parahaemolyticus]ELB2226840.1 hypothetical protein [Vibrio parahaemolyticus]MBE4181272.1 hypothetical protein [Vibrio parahaemolyticus]HCG6849568.1 hypothetical protein [Vibrio parahaemolyticus]HCM0815748.1 hypothetical protein [Vibrio parahaemolyticus]